MSEDLLETTNFEAPPLEELDNLLVGYKFESFIAKGGMGAVYLARQTSLDREVAVKVLPRELSEDEEFVASFQSEAKLMAKLNDPNLIGIYDFGDIDGMLYIIMEFVKGKSLHHSSHGKAINQSIAVDIIKGVCSGLAHAHDAGILHRDVKPANILLGKGAIPKIGDFGLARLNGTTESGIIYGTPGYAAPEVLNAPSKVDNRTDIFAVGVMFYELITGRMPGDTYESVTEFVDADPRFDKIIRKAIHPNIEMRFRSALDFAEELSDIIKNPAPANRLLTSRVADSSTLSSVKLARPLNTSADSARLLNTSSSSNLITDSDNQDSNSSLVTSLSASSSLQSSANHVIARGSASSSKTARNLVIILILLGAIYYVLEISKDKRKEVADTQKVIDAQAAKLQEDKEARLAEIEARRKAKLEAIAKLRNGGTGNSNGDESNTSGMRRDDAHTPVEQLDRIRDLLANGERPMAMMPKTVFTRGRDSRLIMYIDKKMTWDDADAWARAHGGYIAVCKSKSDLTVLMKKLPESASDVWLGAGCNGNKGWTWVDDTPWSDTLSLKNTYDRFFAKFSKLGAVGKAKASEKFTFFIEWRADGTNPADLEFRLHRSSNTLTDLNPQYPAGTITIGARSYFIIKQPMKYSDAAALALTSGGHLLAISNDDEKYQIEAIVNDYFKSGQTIWTAAEKRSDIWKWSTGESWIKLPWLAEHPKDGNRVVIAVREKLMLKDVSSLSEVDGLIIEWSDDKNKARVSSSDINVIQLGDGLQTLKTKAKELVDKQREETDKKHARNIIKLESDLTTLLRLSTKVQRQRQTSSVNLIIAKIKGKTRVPDNISERASSTKIKEITDRAIEKQARLEQMHDKRIEQLRNSYFNKLKSMQQVMAERGQVSAMKAIKKEALNIGQTANDFETHFN